MEEGDHTDCPVELLACRAHQEEERKRTEYLLRQIERDAEELGYVEKWERAMTMPYSPEASRLVDEVWAWLASWTQEHGDEI